MTSPRPTPAPLEQKDGPTYLEVRENFCPKTPGAATHGPDTGSFVFRGQRGSSRYRSYEHESEISLIFATAQAASPPPTTRTQSMAESSNTLRQILERIRDDTQQALKLLGDSEKSRSLRWRCSACGNVKYFTRPVPAEVAQPCPKCRGDSFQALP
jgi:hypothetical protein